MFSHIMQHTARGRRQVVLETASHSALLKKYSTLFSSSFKYSPSIYYQKGEKYSGKERTDLSLSVANGFCWVSFLSFYKSSLQVICILQPPSCPPSFRAGAKLQGGHSHVLTNGLAIIPPFCHSYFCFKIFFAAVIAALSLVRWGECGV